MIRNEFAQTIESRPRCHSVAIEGANTRSGELDIATLTLMAHSRPRLGEGPGF
jgi:hypothetical protein